MSQENKKKNFYGYLNNKKDDASLLEIVDSIEERIIQENNEIKIRNLITNANQLSELTKAMPVLFQDSVFLYTISENVYITNKLNTIQ